MSPAARSADVSSGLASLVPAGLLSGLGRFVVRLGLTLAVVTILCCCFIILRNYVSRLPGYQVHTRTVNCVSLPSWVSAGAKEELADVSDLPEWVSIMDRGLCAGVARSFQKSPWVDRVVSVRRIYPNRLGVELSLRQPVAAVGFRRGYYLVDASARRLSGSLRDKPIGRQEVPAVSSQTTILPGLGEVWPDEGVKAAAAVARALRDSRDALLTRFAAIDVTNVGGARDIHMSDIVLVTKEGTLVQWGRSPLLRNSPGELTAEEKVAKMITFEKKRGPMSGYRYVDVRFDDVQHGPPLHALSDSSVGQ
jgi:hypothetical protein